MFTGLVVICSQKNSDFHSLTNLVFFWVVACSHNSAAEFPAEHWAYLGLTSLKFKSMHTHFYYGLQLHRWTCRIP